MQTLTLDKDEMAAKNRKEKQLQLIEALQDRALELTKAEISLENEEALLDLAQAIECLANSMSNVSKV